jgi:fibronectin type 3 domain-containing protein
VGYFSNAVISPVVEQLTGAGVATGSHSADLTWQGGDTVVGYNIYRGTAHGGPYKQINTALHSSTNYTDSTVIAGTTYYYVTTAVTGAGQESSHSNEAKAVIPSP